MGKQGPPGMFHRWISFNTFEEDATKVPGHWERAPRPDESWLLEHVCDDTRLPAQPQPLPQHAAHIRYVVGDEPHSVVYVHRKNVWVYRVPRKTFLTAADRLRDDFPQFFSECWRTFLADDILVSQDPWAECPDGRALVLQVGVDRADRPRYVWLGQPTYTFHMPDAHPLTTLYAWMDGEDLVVCGLSDTWVVHFPSQRVLPRDRLALSWHPTWHAPFFQSSTTDTLCQVKKLS